MRTSSVASGNGFQNRASKRRVARPVRAAVTVKLLMVGSAEESGGMMEWGLLVFARTAQDGQGAQDTNYVHYRAVVLVKWLRHAECTGYVPRNGLVRLKGAL